MGGIDRTLERSESDPLSFYLRQIAAYPLLTLEQEREIGRSIEEYRERIAALEHKHQSGKLKAGEYEASKTELERILREEKNKLINANLRLVVSIAKKYCNRGLSLLDLIDEGNIGLIEAVERFDYRKGCRFSTYGTWWIRQAIIKALADKSKVIRIPLNMLNTIKKWYLVARHLSQELGRDPGADEVSEYMAIPRHKVEEIMMLSQDAASLDAAVDDENVTSLADLIEDVQTRQPFEMAFHLTLQDTIERVLAQLSEREMKIIKLRFGLMGDGAFTLEETGKALGITRERVRQIQEKAIDKLRKSEVIQDFQER